VNFRPPPTVARFLSSNAFARVVKGPVGSGKSTGCVMEIPRRAIEQAPFDGVRRSRFLIMRNTYRELEDTTRKTFEQWVPAIGGEWQESFGDWQEKDFQFEMRFALPDGTTVESDVLFRSLDRAQDIRKLLSLELTGAYVNELREIPKQAIDVLESRLGRYPSKAQGGPTWFGWWGDTNPWPSAHWGAKLFKKPPEGYELYMQPSGLSVKAENIENLPDGYYERLCRGKDQEYVDVYVRGLDAAATEGSVYGRLLAALRQRGCVEQFEHDNDFVFTAWDFGIADSMAIWWFRFNARRGVDVIDWYENSGFGLPHYFEQCQAKGYKYVTHFLPHDGRSRTWLTGVNAIQMFEEEFGPGSAQIAPELGVDQGIGAARWVLEQETTRFHARCDAVPQYGEYSGIETLGEYRYAWDETNKVFSKTPLHNYASHTADAFRVLACAVQHGELISRKPPPPKPPDLPRVEVAEDGSTHLNRTFDQIAKATIRNVQKHNRRQRV
jgi:hypothetical protein